MSITTTHPALSPQHPVADALNAPLLIAVPDAARLLGIGTTLAWDLVRGGELASVKLGRRVLIPRAALVRLAHADGSWAQDTEGGLDTSQHASLPALHGQR